MTNQRRVVVIGAGISGLVCSFRLKMLGDDVILIEKSDRVGGVIQSERIDGYLIERGPNSSQGTEELLSLLDELGITSELVEGDPKAPAFVCFRDRLHAVPSGPGAFLKSDLLSLGGKLRILKEPFVPARREPSEESVGSFARRRIGREAAERLVAPFVSGIYAGDYDRLSVQAAFPRLANLETSHGGLFRGMLAKAGEARRNKKSAAEVTHAATPARRRLCSFRSGMGFLPKTLASKIGEDLLTGCRNPRLNRIGDSRFEIRFEREDNQYSMSCERVVIATPSNAASLLLNQASTELSSLLSEIDYAPLTIVCLAYDESAIPAPLNGFGFLVPPVEGMNILGCVWNSSLFKERAPTGKVLLTVFIGGALNPGAAQAADAEMVSAAARELQKVLRASNDPHVVAITRYERSIPQYNLGHFRRVQRIESLLPALSGLSLIGNYLHGVSTGDCIKEADRVAREVFQSLR